ncbi:MAG: hypothetical protein ACREYF_17045 [Gammaproteobacteria bacterium]
MVSASDYYTDLCKSKPEVARRALRYAHVLESTEGLFKQQLDCYSDSLLTWPMLYLGNVQRVLVITHCYIEMVTKPYSELTHLIERQMHQVAQEIHEIEKEDKELGYEAGPKKYEAPEATPPARKAG